MDRCYHAVPFMKVLKHSFINYAFDINSMQHAVLGGVEEVT